MEKDGDGGGEGKKKGEGEMWEKKDGGREEVSGHGEGLTGGGGGKTKAIEMHKTLVR